MEDQRQARSSILPPLGLVLLRQESAIERACGIKILRHKHMVNQSSAFHAELQRHLCWKSEDAHRPTVQPAGMHVDGEKVLLLQQRALIEMLAGLHGRHALLSVGSVLIVLADYFVGWLNWHQAYKSTVQFLILCFLSMHLQARACMCLMG